MIDRSWPLWFATSLIVMSRVNEDSVMIWSSDGAEQLVLAGQLHGFDRRVVGGVHQAVGPGQRQRLRTVEEDPAVAGADVAGSAPTAACANRGAEHRFDRLRRLLRDDDVGRASCSGCCMPVDEHRGGAEHAGGEHAERDHRLDERKAFRGGDGHRYTSFQLGRPSVAANAARRPQHRDRARRHRLVRQRHEHRAVERDADLIDEACRRA